MKVKGFTLIELLIAIVVVGILAMVALPSYQDSIRKARRSDAMQTLLELAQREERNLYTNNAYTTTLATLNWTGTDSFDGHYTISITQSAATDYTVSVIPKAGDNQTKDSRCQLFSLTSTGVKSANDKSDGSGNDTSNACWGS